MNCTWQHLFSLRFLGIHFILVFLDMTKNTYIEEEKKWQNAKTGIIRCLGDSEWFHKLMRCPKTTQESASWLPVGTSYFVICSFAIHSWHCSPRKKERFHKAGTGPSRDKDTVKCQNESTRRRSQPSSFYEEMLQDSIRSNIVLFLESKMIKSPNWHCLTCCYIKPSCAKP